MQKAQQAATAGEAPGRQAASAPTMAERLLEPQFVPLSVSNIAASAASTQSRPLGLKIRFYRPTPESAEQLVLELEVPLW